MGILFGTDGIRGIANQYPMLPETAMKVGRAVASVLRKNHRARIVIGKDTRLSGDMIACALAAGISSAGGDVCLAGVIPTPAVAYLASSQGFDAGIVVSASHNPYYDNGIKLFDHKGFKLPGSTEEQIEAIVLEQGQKSGPEANCDRVGTIELFPGANERYIDFLAGSGLTDTNFSGLHVILDCSNGATCHSAPSVFLKLGAAVTTLFDAPDGVNINENCGSQHIETLSAKVVEAGADLGLAFDGDGDRLIAVDEKGKAVTGDTILAICAREMKSEGKLRNNVVVSTVMSNFGLKSILEEMEIDHQITDVGDRHVLARMLETGAVIGGEDSGHMIFLDRHTSGDGILTGIRLMETMVASKKALSELAGMMKIYPQILKNVSIREKTDIFEIPEISNKIKEVEAALGDRGRVLVRYSGTQPLCRVMVEGPDRESTARYCQQIVDVIGDKIGG